MKLSQLRKAYLMDLASRFTGPFHKKKAASFRTDAVKPTAPASKIPHDVYGELAFRFLEAWQKEKEQKVRICLFGQPGAGKSSLINELIGEKKAKVGTGTDTTKEAQVIESGSVVYVDLPGYDTARFPKKGYFSHFDPLQYDLFLCIFSGKLTEADTEFFSRLQRLGRVCLFVRNKIDGLYAPFRSLKSLEEEIQKDVRHQVGPCAPLYFTSFRKDWGNAQKRGIPNLQEAIMDHLEPALKDRYARHAKAYTEHTLLLKRRAADRRVRKYTAMAAANGLNPVVGMDAVIDARILKEMYQGIRTDFGLGKWDLPIEGNRVNLVKKVAGGVTGERVTKGLSLLLRKRAGEKAAKFIPLAGAAAASLMNAGSMYYVGKEYVRICYEYARRRLQTEIEWGTHEHRT